MTKRIEPSPKNNKLRNAECYGMQEMQDLLYEQSKKGEEFTNLMQFITNDNNILLAYRAIKNNAGSYTASVDKQTVQHIMKLSQEEFLQRIKREFKRYQPRMVKRKDIPKKNGDTRPLGIPSIWDRIIQQCILQIMEPICEAKFYKNSFGFRPTRSSEHAMACAMRMVNTQETHYSVDIDIMGFFNEVKHTKLMRQLWSLGIRDKQLLVIIRKILKAPIKMPDGTVEYPKKGTPQGGILSPLLANINLNEFDWWIANQWENREIREIKPQYTNNTGKRKKSNEYRKLRNSTKLKEVYIVRYADDLKLFTKTRTEASKIFIASQMWLDERLSLPISKEKSRITNLKKERSEFLGFTLRVIKKRKRHGKWKRVAETHVAPKALKKIHQELKEQIKIIQRSPNSNTTLNEINKYNSKVMGIHNYYAIATKINYDMKSIGRHLEECMYNRFPKAKHITGKRRKKNTTYTTKGYTNIGSYKGKNQGVLKYLRTHPIAIRYLMGMPILPIRGIRTRNAVSNPSVVNKYTVEGRAFIHKNQHSVNPLILKWMREHPVTKGRATVEFNDNRLALFVAQKGRCAISGMELSLFDIHCHHKEPWIKTKNDHYDNLIIVRKLVHKLIHATNSEKIAHYLTEVNLTEAQLDKLNILRRLVGLADIKNNEISVEQLTLF